MTFRPSAHGDTPPPLTHADVLNGWSQSKNTPSQFICAHCDPLTLRCVCAVQLCVLRFTATLHDGKKVTLDDTRTDHHHLSSGHQTSGLTLHSRLTLAPLLTTISPVGGSGCTLGGTAQWEQLAADIAPDIPQCTQHNSYFPVVSTLCSPETQMKAGLCWRGL